MSLPSIFTVLHISDFHYSARRKQEQLIVVDALVRDLNRICIGHRRPDLIFFTGDMVRAGGKDLHDDAYDAMLDRVSKVTGCSDERIFIVPGNHDIDSTAVEKFGKDTVSWREIVGATDEEAKLNTLYEERAFENPVASKFSHFNSLEQYLSSGSGRKRRLNTPFAIVDHLEPLNLDVLVLNTAALSIGGVKELGADEKKLAIPEYAVIEAIKALTPGSLRIVASHHPLSMLSEECGRFLEGELSRHTHLHLFGHMHDPQPRNFMGLKGSLLSLQAGAIFTSRKGAYNGYSLITIDRSQLNYEVMLRSYFKDRDEFDEAIDIVEGGRWWPSQQSRQFFRTIATPINDADFREHLCGPALTALSVREAAVGGDGDIHDRFVPPPLFLAHISEPQADESRVEVDTPIALSEVLSGDTNVILYAKPEYGRTTLLRELRYRLLADAKTIRFPRLPVYIEFPGIGNNSSTMLRHAKGCAETTPAESDLESLLKLGHVCMLIDDVQFSNIKQMKVLREFVAQFPKARYILSSPEDSTARYGALIDPEMPLRFEFIQLQEFRRNHMRQLLAKEERCSDVEEWLDRLQTEFREINLPFTAANGTILIEILSEKYNFSPINRSVLMEQFVDSTLRKAEAEQGRRKTFDYTNKTDLLSHLAAWLARRDEYVVEREKLREEAKAYLDNKGLNVDLDGLLEEFLHARILISRSEERICFRYRGVLEYFIALRMTVDKEFRAWVLQEERYLNYVSEIQYYAGKLRNDADLVELVGRRNEEILGAAFSSLEEIDLHQFDHIQVPLDDQENSIDVLAQEVTRPPLTQEEKDAELEAELPKACDSQDVSRPKLGENSDRVLLSLSLYSGVIKNMELIPDSDKRKHLAKIWQGWALLLFAGLRVAPRLAKERKFRVNGVQYEIQAPHSMADATLLRQLMLRMPHAHVTVLSAALGTDKLERQLTEPQFDEVEEPKIIKFLRTGVIADLRLPATPKTVSALAAEVQNCRYLLWSLIVHLNELRRMDRVRENHFKQLEQPLAQAIADLRGGTHAERQQEKRKEMARLQKERITIQMKRNQEHS